MFVIPAQERTLLRLARRSSIPRAHIRYDDVVMSDVYVEGESHGGYAENPLSITKNKKITLTLDGEWSKAMADVGNETLVYHVEFDDGVSGGETCLQALDNPLVSTITLQQYMKAQKIHLTSCKKITPHDDTWTITTTNTYRQ